ncbi:alpha/beta hydrolase [Kitasatospora sp. NPDC001664]
MAESFALLLRQNFGDLEEAASSWRKLGESAGEAQQRHRSQAAGPLLNWQSPAAGAARGELDKAEQQLGIVNAEATAIAVVLDTVHRRMSEAQQELRAAVSEAESNNYRVGDDGSVTGPQLDPAYRNDPDYQEINRQQNARLGEFRQRIDAAVQKAERASADGAVALGSLNGDVVTADPAKAQGEVANDINAMRSQLGLGPVVPTSDDPTANAKWWAGLSPQQQREYLALYPGEIGNLNGISSEVRDLGNRENLERQLDLAGPGGHNYQQMLDLRNRMDQEEAKGKDVFLLGFDPKDDGKAIVSFGNPDTAKNTAVFVPGTTVDLGDMNGYMDKMRDLQRAADQKSNTGDTATIMWLGYDAPDDIVKDAPFNNYAEDGAPKLDSYIDSLGTTHDPGTSRHTTVIGHSYGSVVVGEAAKNGNGLAVDDIVVAGSPGMHVPYARDLNIDPRHVWAAEADWDPVPSVGGLGHGRSDGWFDLPNTPTSEEFGANRITTEGNSGHSSYWDDNGKPHSSLDNQASIVAGNYRDVQLEWGSAP